MFGFSWRSLRPVTAFNWSKASDVLNIFLLKWRNLCSLNRSNFKLKRSNFVLPKEQFFSIIQAISVDLLYQHFSKRGANSVALFKWWPHQGAMKCLLHPCPTWVESFEFALIFLLQWKSEWDLILICSPSITFSFFFVVVVSCLFVLLHFKA